MKNVFLTKISEFLEFRQTSVLIVGYPGFQKKKQQFCDKLILNIKVKVNVNRLNPTTQILVTAK